MDTTPKSEDKPKGINWLSILGIVVLVILIFLVVWAVMIMNIAKENPIIKDVIALEEPINEMLGMTLSQIEAEAVVLEADELGKDPYGYRDRYVIVTGSMSKEESIGVSQNIAMNMFSENKAYKGYVLSDAIVAIDISGEGPDAPEGALLRAYGKLFVLSIEDVWELPIIGPDLKTEFGDVEGMSDTVVFVIARGVEVIATPPDVVDEPLPGEMGSEARTPGADEAPDIEAAGGDEAVEEAPAEDEGEAAPEEEEAGEEEEPEAA